MPVLVASLMASTTAARVRAGVVYQITVDTSGFPALTPANVDLQLNPADPMASPLVTAVITSFSAGVGGVTGSPDVFGDVSGTLPGPLTLTNSTSFNDYYQSLNTGSLLSLMVSLDGPAFSETATTGTTFLLALYQEDGQTPLGGVTDDPTVVQIDLIPNGVSPGVTTTFNVGPGYPGGPPATVTAVPEPAASTLGGTVAALGLFAALRRRSAS